MDLLDLQILRILQKDCSQSISEVARKVGLSSSPCWKRINRLIKDGTIVRQCAVLDHSQLGFGLVAFVSIKTTEHSDSWLESFSSKIKLMPEVLEFHRMAGDVDYMVKVITEDVDAFDKFYKNLVKIAGLGEVTSRFSMEKIKDSNALPI